MNFSLQPKHLRGWLGWEGLGRRRDAACHALPYGLLRWHLQMLSEKAVLSWPNAAFNLQSAPEVTGTYTNIPAAASPYANPVTGGRQFFRLIGNWFHDA